MDKREIFYRNGFVKTEDINSTLKGVFQYVETDNSFLQMEKQVDVSIKAPEEMSSEAQKKLNSITSELFKAFGVNPKIKIERGATALMISYNQYIE